MLIQVFEFNLREPRLLGMLNRIHLKIHNTTFGSIRERKKTLIGTAINLLQMLTLNFYETLTKKLQEPKFGYNVLIGKIVLLMVSSLDQ